MRVLLSSLSAAVLALAGCGMELEEGLTDENVIGSDEDIASESAALKAKKSKGSGGSTSTTPPDCRNPATWPSGWTSLEDQVLVLVNQRRAQGATCGTTYMPPVPPLVNEPALRQASRCHSLDMGKNDFLGHAGSDGSSPWMRIAAAGYTGSPTAENVAAGYSSASSVVAGWMASPGHCAAIMSPNSTETGIGYAYVTDGVWGVTQFRHYWTETFGRR